MKKLIIIIALSMPVYGFSQIADSSKRLVRLQGTLNFRDVGGYKTADGHTVKWNKIFRSDAINHLTDRDMDILKEKHIYTVVDLRGKKEAAAAPDRLLPGTDYVLSPAGSDKLPTEKQMAEIIRQGHFLDNFYGDSGVIYFAERYRPVFQKLLTVKDTSAVLYHCTGGRDRTGMATALLLYILGVPEKTIYADFTASNIYLKPMMDKMTTSMAASTKLSKEKIKEEMELRPKLIKIFFSAIKKKYGSMDMFIKNELMIDEHGRQILKGKYLM